MQGFFVPERQPTVWLSSGIEAKADVFSSEKTGLRRLYGRDARAARIAIKDSSSGQIFSKNLDMKEKPTAWLFCA